MNKLLSIFKSPDLRKKVLAVFGWVFVFRLFAAIPIPAIDTARLAGFLESNQLLGFLNVFSGGGLSHLSIAMLGVGPYITATIIMQLLTIVFPNLKKAYHEEGAAGRAKLNRISRLITVPLAMLQGYGFLNLLMAQQIIPKLGFLDLATDVTIIAAGAMFLMWIGETISEYKIGNGTSIIITAGIVASLPGMIGTAMANYAPSMLPSYLAFAAVAVAVIAGVVYVSEGERKIPVSYAKQLRGGKVVGGASTYLPVKVNQAGVIPIIFAISILLFPQFIAQSVGMFSPDLSARLSEYVAFLTRNQWVYNSLYFVLVVAFTYFYTAITFDTKEIAKNLQQSGGFIPGIRPGQATADTIDRIVSRITLSGAFFLGGIAILPNLVQALTGVQSMQIGGTALLIVVAVALDMMRQIESQLTVREYEGIL